MNTLLSAAMDPGLSPTRSLDLPAATGPQSCPENLLTFTCEFKPGPESGSPGGDEESSPDCEAVTVVLPSQCSVYQLRLRICLQVKVQNFHPDPFAILDPEKYTLLYAKGGDWYEAYDDCEIVRTLDIPWSRDDAGRLSAHIVVTPPAVADSEENKKQQQCLANLIGHDLENEASDRLDELTFTRRKLVSPRSQELKIRNDTLYATEPWITCVPVSAELQERLKRKLPVTLHYQNKISFSIEVDYNATPEVLFKVFRTVLADQGHDIDSSESLVLKVTGREEFISGEHALVDFLWVRHCLKTNQDFHLSVIHESQLADDSVKFVDWLLVDGFSGKFSCHEDLCLEGKDLDDIVMISLWDCNRNLRVKLLGFDIPSLPSKCPQAVYVKASIFYGNRVISSVSSTPKTFADEVLWNEWLEFDVLLSNLPRGAKLGFTITDNSPMAKDSEDGKELYFVNLLLIDHRSVLSQGPYTLHMWAYPGLEEKGPTVTYQADKLSSATNPDVVKSMAISFFLDHYNFPVVLPNSFGSPDCPDPSTSTLSPAKATSPTQGFLSSSPSTPSPTLSSPGSSIVRSPSSATVSPNTPSPLATMKRSYLKRFREESIQYASNLPQYLRGINWMNRKVVEEVHWLLGNWDPADLDITLALELLSMDFADEVVRRLAVNRLDSLSNDDVLRYLLQLVQTLKVEPYHDSCLARFLIQRALRSKRIGHFFFWYVRSEVASCPYFRQRMAVILEAYLLGCGQAMLSSFIQQVQVADTLQEVAVTIKKLYPDRDPTPAASVKLQELLRNCDLPNEFLLPFDPRIKVGTLLLDKCKVMSSKKKPLWLEFSPMPSPTPVTPVGIIFKEGDDLRQDMLVLQTLVIMDSIWQEKSLDLNLIPYGCISTGHNIGLIEIVRNATTIAAVQRSHKGTVGAFKTEALKEWLKSKSPLQEVHSNTVHTFVKSCAGYCVATYVLGIGDRHNDNIMITEQGNLFHIDFGHIMGNTKHFLGINRERVPFVLTPDFLFVMGREKGHNPLYFQFFRETCSQAYLALRSHSGLLVTLFSLMLLTGIPELSGTKDIQYLRGVLQDDLNEAAAKEHFLKQIAVCEEEGWKVQVNWWIHRMACNGTTA